MSDRTWLTGFGPSGFFAFRTPLLPFDELLAWGEGPEAPLAGVLRARLRAIVTRPEVREALFVASPSLDAQFSVWLQNPESEKGQKVERSLVRYFSRMAGRPTPFGLFAGCSLGTVGKETRLRLAERAGYQRHARLDMDYLVALAEKLERDPALRQTLTYRPNSSLYGVPGRLRYHEYRSTDKGRTHHAVSVEDSDYLQTLLSRAARGATMQALAAALVEGDADASQEEAEEYVRELIDNQVLVADLSPAVTGPEPIHGLVARLRQHPAVSHVAERLGQANRELQAINDAPLGLQADRYHRVAGLLEELPAKVDPAKLFQVDMVKPTDNACLGETVVEEIRRSVELLHRLAGAPRQEELARFRRAFAERYQGQAAPPYEARWVPLVEVLDEEIGIGFGTVNQDTGSTLLENLDFPMVIDATVPWTRRETFLLRKLSEALSRGEQQVVLEPADLDALANPKPPPLPDAFAVMATLAAGSDTELNAGDFQVLLDGVWGPSGATLLGRFCHADPVLERHVQEHLRAEEALHEGAVFAEVVHVPEEGRLGNILARPLLREYEIVYLGQSGAPLEKQIPITDLLVTVTGDEVLLCSRRLGRHVIPRLTSAHNFNGRGKGLYRFLCLLQGQNVTSLGWSWGALQHAPFLPRVVYGKLVLARARWLLSQKELKALGAAHGEQRFRQVQQLRERLRWPRWVVLADGDNELPVDLDNVLGVETFIELVKGRTQAVVQEMFPGPDQLCANGPEGRFVHEIIVPFVRQGPKGHKGLKGPESVSFAPRSSSVQRSFSPGSEWLYAKLYTGAALSDQLLRDLVQPVTTALLQSGAADGWFFIRYGDPDWHLRLRYHGQPARLLTEALPLLHRAAAPFLADGRVWKMQLDTYEREVERYGGPAGIEQAEKLFQADSEAIVALAPLLTDDARGELRWRLALLGMDLLLDDLGFDLSTKHGILSRLREGFAREHHAEGNLKHQLGLKYRQERKNLEAVLGPDAGGDEPLRSGATILRRRSARLAPIVAELKALERGGQLGLPLTELATSYLHMHANRLLRSGQRVQEMVLYDFLYRLYESQSVRKNGARRSAEPTREPVLA